MLPSLLPATSAPLGVSVVPSFAASAAGTFACVAALSASSVSTVRVCLKVFMGDLPHF